jgi:hypothetical protein
MLTFCKLSNTNIIVFAKALKMYEFGAPSLNIEGAVFG